MVTLVRESQVPGRYATEWNGSSADGKPVPPGIYFCRLEIGTRVLTKKIALLR
jgi:hypothetical protein